MDVQFVFFFRLLVLYIDSCLSCHQVEDVETSNVLVLKEC